MISVEGFSRYLISECGDVFDVKLNRNLLQQITTDGYCKVTLNHNSGKRKGMFVHRLVAMAYIPNLLNKSEVNHIDGFKEHNWPGNLEWATHAENIQHAWDTGLIINTEQRSNKISTKTGLNGKDNPRARSVVCVTTGEIFETIKDAVIKYKVQQSQLSKCCAGTYGAKSAGVHPVTGAKLIWKYLETTDE